MVAQWIEQTISACRESKTNHLDIIIDQAALDFSVIPALNILSIEWQSLYSGLPEAFIVDAAPLLIRIDFNDEQQQQWLYEISAQAAPKASLLLLGSVWQFPRLAEWLTQCTDILQAGREGILRFYDTRIFPLLFSHILNEQQQNALLRPALFWSWQDLDGRPQAINGNGLPWVPNEKNQKIDLSDLQLEHLMCICDVLVLLSHYTPSASVKDSPQKLFSNYFSGMLEATNQGILLDQEREDWVINNWVGEQGRTNES